MLSAEQKKWLNHLSDTEKIRIIPYNPENKAIFKLVKPKLTKILGKVRISLRGSTCLGISGQGELDVYIPVTSKDFNAFLNKLIKYLGKHGSLYPLERARFVKFIQGIKIEIFLINKNCRGWKDGIAFEKFLRNNRKYLLEYEKLKLKCNGFSVKEYYTAKVKFINKILSKY